MAPAAQVLLPLILALAPQPAAARTRGPDALPDAAAPRLLLSFDLGGGVSIAEKPSLNVSGFSLGGASSQGAATGGLGAAWAPGPRRQYAIGAAAWVVAAPRERIVLGLGPTFVARHGPLGPFVELTPSVTALWTFGGPNHRYPLGVGVRGAIGSMWQGPGEVKLGAKLSVSHSQNPRVEGGYAWTSRCVSLAIVIAR
jgi:hypothetical protein